VCSGSLSWQSAQTSLTAPTLASPSCQTLSPGRPAEQAAHAAPTGEAREGRRESAGSWEGRRGCRGWGGTWGVSSGRQQEEGLPPPPLAASVSWEAEAAGCGPAGAAGAPGVPLAHPHAVRQPGAHAGRRGWGEGPARERQAAHSASKGARRREEDAEEEEEEEREEEEEEEEVEDEEEGGELAGGSAVLASPMEARPVSRLGMGQDGDVDARRMWEILLSQDSAVLARPLHRVPPQGPEQGQGQGQGVSFSTLGPANGRQLWHMSSLPVRGNSQGPRPRPQQELVPRYAGGARTTPLPSRPTHGGTPGCPPLGQSSAQPRAPPGLPVLNGGTATVRGPGMGTVTGTVTGTGTGTATGTSPDMCSPLGVEAPSA